MWFLLKSKDDYLKEKHKRKHRCKKGHSIKETVALIHAYVEWENYIQYILIICRLHMISLSFVKSSINISG